MVDVSDTSSGGEEVVLGRWDAFDGTDGGDVFTKVRGKESYVRIM